MALAKHHEEIGERWVTNTSDRYETLLANLFDQLPPVPLQAGEVYLIRSGRRMEDIEVCELGETLDLAVETRPGSAVLEIEVLDETGSHALKQKRNGHISVPFRKTGCRRIQVGSGGFLKIYTVYAVEPLRIEELPDFAKLIQSLSENPPEWNDATFGEFRTRLEQILAENSVPTIFADGLIEYHLALFHQERRLISFRERFTAAYGNLRWFIPYSDVARLICAYYLFCANEFEAADKLMKGQRSRLRHTVSFFLTGKGPKQSGVASKVRTGLALLVALSDLMLFRAVEALENGRSRDAAEFVAVARRHTLANFDRERTARLAYIDAHVKEASGDTNSARSTFEALRHSPWQSIAAAATKHFDPDNGKFN